MRNIHLCFNRLGLYADGWVCHMNIDNIFGYINQFGLLHANPKYGWRIQNVWSNADSWNSTVSDNSPIYVGTRQDVTMENVVVAGAYGNNLCPQPLMVLAVNRAEEESIEWYSGHIILRNIFLFGTESDAIRVLEGYGQIDIENIHAGSTGIYGFYGGPGNIKGQIVRDYDDDNVAINVRGGYVKSEANPKRCWFYLWKNGAIKDVENFSPFGVITDPFNTVKATVGLYWPNGCTSQPASNTDYKAVNTDLLITSSGGTGVNITIKDPSGNTVASGLTALNAQHLPVGYKINFGNFTAAPNVTASGI
jgi:hypothetical protein